MIQKYLLIFILILNAIFSRAQVVYEPAYHTVYPFLSRLSQKGAVDLDDIVLPLSKDYIYSKLDELSKKIHLLTPLEREELAFYLKEYTLWWRKDPKSGFEGEFKALLNTRIGDRFRTYAYQDRDFSLNIQPIIGFRSESRNEYSYIKNWKGFWVYGMLGKHLGYSMDFRATSETGRLEDYQRRFSTETGVIGTMPNFKTFDFNETNISINYSWNWASVSLGKNYMPIGYGYGGKIILSDKAPSFPQIRLDIKPKSWLSFNYAHAWLNSNIVDSATIRSTSILGKFEFQYRNKYLATHNVTIRPTSNFALTVGESAIYSDKLRIEYLIPLSLFSGMSHYMGELENNSISNSSLYGQLSVRNIPRNTHIFASIFIDELRLKNVQGDSTSSRNHTAYQLGISLTDLPIKNLFFQLEYIKVQPFAYIHFLPAQTYQNNGYNLGNWTGPNSDEIYIQLLYRIARGLELRADYYHVRRGTVGTAKEQVADNRNLYPFLWGDVVSDDIFQLQAQYEPIHDLFFRLGYKHQSSVDFKKNNLLVNFDHVFFSASFGF
ncbi:hypothetical protein [Flectobacillus sp. BAB-3569]|uniref:hypothetical protein n=1 Tax=Flectobacillus sp. BAB-3569 TaxID=1509483 RepID=UPI000BA415A2|nr:hypothetical protein [Flectobacillus sp. BAB-3569]PAC30614.1 hypothetical protein BWI92_11300 [Flectobacillus sp. BAB-3569]